MAKTLRSELLPKEHSRSWPWDGLEKGTRGFVILSRQQGIFLLFGDNYLWVRSYNFSQGSSAFQTGRIEWWNVVTESSNVGGITCKAIISLRKGPSRISIRNSLTTRKGDGMCVVFASIVTFCPDSRQHVPSSSLGGIARVNMVT